MDVGEVAMRVIRKIRIPQTGNREMGKEKQSRNGPPIDKGAAAIE